MRTIERYKTTMYYIVPVDFSENVDEFGDYTGEISPVYSKVKTVRFSENTQSVRNIVEEYGLPNDTTLVYIITRDEADIQNFEPNNKMLFFLKEPTDYSKFDYKVTDIKIKGRTYILGLRSRA